MSVAFEPIVYGPSSRFTAPELENYAETDETRHEKVAVYFRTIHGARTSRNLDQITWYFEKRCPHFLDGWLKEERTSIENLRERGWDFVGEYNASGIASMIRDADRDALKAMVSANYDNFETVYFWMDDDFIRAWVFRRPDPA
jgi:hypothetical protein